MFRGKAPRTENGEQPLLAEACSNIVLVCNDTAEFSLERQCLWHDVLPELQSFAFNAGFDIEWSDVLVEESKLNNATSERVNRILDASTNNWLIVLLGDKYGAVEPPTTIPKLQYDKIKAAAFENNADVKLLDENYVIDRSFPDDLYRLKATIAESKTRGKLAKIVQKGAAAAFDEGTINQIDESAQRRLFYSPIHHIVEKALTRSDRVTFVMRRFEQAKSDVGTNSKFVEKTEEAARKIADLKNQVSAQANEKSIFSHSFTLESGGNVSQFLTSRCAEKYRETLSRQITERLKSQLGTMNASTSSVAVATPAQLAKDEDATHMDYLSVRLNEKWSPRKVDDRLKEITSGSHTSIVYHLQGGDVSGKTQAICRLYSLVPSTFHKIIRFVDLSNSSLFAHELWRMINIQLCQIMGQNMQAVLKAFTLSECLDAFVQLLLHLDRPLALFLDDIHLLKHGHTLSQLERKVQSAPTNLWLFVTSSVSSPTLSCPFSINHTINIDQPDHDEIINILSQSLQNRRISSEQWSMVKSQLHAGNCNLVVAKTLRDEILDRGVGNMNNGIDGRLERLEGIFGSVLVSTVCKYLVATSHGLTRLELHDLLCSDPVLLEKLELQSTMPPLLLDQLLNSFGSLLYNVILDRRRVFRFAHSQVLAAVRQRYGASNAQMNPTHCRLADFFSDMFSDIAEAGLRQEGKLVYQMFPQAMKREQGGFNVRRIRNHWYHLLHTGNMDALKEQALCNFEYIDSTVRACGLSHLLTMYEECAMQVLHHDLQVLCEQVFLPALPTIVRDSEQLAAELIGRLRYSRGENSHFLNSLVEQGMAWVDTYSRQPLLVPLSCWISPPTMKTCRNFSLKDWAPGKTVLAPTQNHQFALISGNLTAPGLVYMYHIPSQLLITTFKGHSAAVTCIVSAFNAQFFITTSEDVTVRKWSFSTVGQCEVYKPHTGKITCAVLSSRDDFFVTGASDSTAKVIDVETGRTLRTFHEHTGSVVALQLTSDNHFLITGSGDFVVQMWDLATGACVNKMGGLMAPVCSLALTPNDAFLAVACEDETLRIFSTVSGQELHELQGHEGKVNSLVCAQDDCQLFAGTKGKIFTYDLHNGALIDSLDCSEKSPVCSLKLSSDNYFLISGCGKRIHAWNINKRTHDAHDVSLEKEGFLTAIAISHDEKVAACGTFNGIVALWDLDICQCVNTVPQEKGIPISCLVFTIDGSHFICGNSSGTLSVLESSNGNIIRNLNLHTVEIVSICPLESDKVLSCSKDGKLFMWDIYDEEEGFDMMSQGIQPPIYVQPNGAIMIGHCTNNPKEMKVWAFNDDGPVQKNRMTHNAEITCFSATVLGTLVVTGSADFSLKIWQIDSGFLTQALVGHEGVVTCCALAEDERVVASGSEDMKVIVWNVQTGQVLHSMSTNAPLTSIVLTADATVLFTGNRDGWLEAWYTSKGRIMSSFNAHRPIRYIVQSYAANRMLVHLTGCAQLPILCLHNSPAGTAAAAGRRQIGRASISSLGNDAPGETRRDVASSSNTLQTAGPSAPRSAQPRPTFDKLERSKSRTSLIEKDRPTTQTTTTLSATQKSSTCVLL